MKPQEQQYLQIGYELGGERSQMFGKPCFKVGGKAFMSLFEDEVVFKLSGPAHAEALGLRGARLFDPSGKGRAMKEWVQVPYEQHHAWAALAKAAIQYVGG